MDSKPGASAPKFTSRPWKAVECAVTAARAEEYVTALVRGAVDPAANLMVVTQASEDVTREGHVVVAVVGNGPTSPANAALIAAGPDLYAAGEEVHTAGDAFFDTQDAETRLRFDRALSALWVALSKARGERA